MGKTSWLSIIGILLGVLTIGTILWGSYEYNKPQTYQQVLTPIKQGMQIVRHPEKQKKPIVVVLERTGCPWCIKRETEIVHDVKFDRLRGEHVLVLDVSKMSFAQQFDLRVAFPQIIVNGADIPTPATLRATPQKSGWRVTAYCKNGKPHDLRSVLLGEAK